MTRQHFFVSGLKFPDSPECYSDGMVVHFTAVVEKQTIRCAISIEALASHFEKGCLDPVAAFFRHQTAIEVIVDRLIFQRRFENNGSLLIRSSDC